MSLGSTLDSCECPRPALPKRGYAFCISPSPSRSPKRMRRSPVRIGGMRLSDTCDTIPLTPDAFRSIAASPAAGNNIDEWDSQVSVLTWRSSTSSPCIAISDHEACSHDDVEMKSIRKELSHGLNPHMEVLASQLLSTDTCSAETQPQVDADVSLLDDHDCLALMQEFALMEEFKEYRRCWIYRLMPLCQ